MRTYVQQRRITLNPASMAPNGARVVGSGTGSALLVAVL
jgi:hypothetical protein